jgi:hypothetical protein
MGWRGCVDHASITLGRPGKSLRRWLPLQSLQGYLGLRGVWVILTSSTLPVRLTVTGCFLFFFLFTEFLVSKLSLDEEDGMEGDLASKEGEEDLTGEEGEGST